MSDIVLVMRMKEKLERVRKIDRILYEEGVGATRGRAITLAKAIDEGRDILEILSKFVKNKRAKEIAKRIENEVILRSRGKR